MCDQQRLRPACAYTQSGQSLCKSLEYSLTVTLLTEQNLELLSLKGDCTGVSDSTHVEMPRCWKSHVEAYMCICLKTRGPRICQREKTLAVSSLLSFAGRVHFIARNNLNHSQKMKKKFMK